MKGRTFLDTNVLVYADDVDAGEKHERAIALVAEALRSHTGVISTQILQEYFTVATRKLGVPTEVVRRKIELLGTLTVVVIRPSLILEAIDLHRLHAVSFWDALVLRAAAAAGCRRLLTEDLQHGQVLDNVRIENPFRPVA